MEIFTVLLVIHGNTELLVIEVILYPIAFEVFTVERATKVTHRISAYIQKKDLKLECVQVHSILIPR